jgi:hypothetical protein
MADILELVSAKRAGTRYSGGAFASERHFLDFVINQRSLRERIAKATDSVSVLCSEFQRDETMKAVNRLLLREKAEIPPGRRSLFICSECGDLGCGAITAMVVKEGSSIVWKEFGYENNYEENVLFEDYRDIGPYTFEWAHYEGALLQGVKSLPFLGR